MRGLLLLPLAAFACSKSESSSAPNPEPKPGSGGAVVVLCDKVAPAGKLPWIEDDYANALACAKHDKRPIVLDLWAPWCHTCLSMQSTVFADPSFKKYTEKFVFLALDTDRDHNAAAVAKFPPSAWPTFYVIGPDEQVLARFVGAASVEQFQAFLDNGLRAMAGGVAGADAHLLAAERHQTKKEHADVERELRAALKDAPTSWPRRADALTSLIAAIQKQKKFAECLELAEKSMDDTGNTASVTDFLYPAMGCAKERAKDEPDRVKTLRERAVARLQKLVDDPQAPLSIDDRGDAMANLRETLDQLDRKDDAKKIAEKQRALLDEAAANAKTPIAAMTFSWPRAEVYVYLGRPLDLVPSLEKLAKDLPKEYDPPARLGWLHLKGDKLPEAVKWTDQAIALAYGPRKAKVLAQRAEIAAKQRDWAGARKYREAIIKLLEALPPTQTTPEAINEAKNKLADVPTPDAPAPK